MLLLITTVEFACLTVLSIYDLREGRLPIGWVAALTVLCGVHFFLSDIALGLTDIAIGLVAGPGILLFIRVLFQCPMNA